MGTALSLQALLSRVADHGQDIKGTGMGLSIVSVPWSAQGTITLHSRTGNETGSPRRVREISSRSRFPVAGAR